MPAAAWRPPFKLRQHYSSQPAALQLQAELQHASPGLWRHPKACGGRWGCRKVSGSLGFLQSAIPCTLPCQLNSAAT